MRTRVRLAMLATLLPTLALGCAEATRSGAAHEGYILTRSIAPEFDPDDPFAMYEAGGFEVVETENRPYREGEPVTYVENIMGIELRATGRNLMDAKCQLNKIRIDETLRDTNLTAAVRESFMQTRERLEAACDLYR